MARTKNFGNVMHSPLRSLLESLRPTWRSVPLGREDAIALGLLTLFAAFLFRLHIFGLTTYFGNPDRLNNNLKVQKYYVDGLAESGRVQAWNGHELLGYDTLSLPYTFPNPLTYVMEFLGQGNFYVTAGFITALLFTLAGCFAYLFIREIVRDRFAALVGGALYQLCTLTILKASQNDMSFMVLVLLPPLFLLIRTAVPVRAPGNFFFVSAIVYFLVQFTFLQKVAYVLLAAGAYSATLSIARRDITAFLVLVSASVVGVVSGAPRLIGLAETMHEYARAGAGGPYLSKLSELLRLGDPFIFGRGFSDATSIGNFINLSEGWLLYYSAAGLVLIALSLWRTVCDRTYLSPASRLEVAYFWIALIFAGAVLFVVPLARLVHVAFMGFDFIHARILIVASLPACVLIAGALDSLYVRRGIPLKPSLLGPREQAVGLGVAILLIVVIELAAKTGKSWAFIPAIQLEDFRVRSAEMGAIALSAWWIKVRPFLRLVLTVAVAGWLVGTVVRGGHRATTAYLALGWLAMFQALIVANMQMNGSHVVRSSSPFQGGDFYQAPRGTFAAPTLEEKARMHGVLETERYRSVAICDPKIAHGFCAAHVAERWGLRLADGYYGLGTPRRLAMMPLGKLVGLRHIVLTTTDNIPWAQLALLNVKYALVVTPEIYGYSHAGLPRRIPHYVNPFLVTPRGFFVDQVIPVDSAESAATHMHGSIDVTKASFVESFASKRRFHAGGDVRFAGSGDELLVSFEPSSAERFLVVNELFHPRWTATVDGRPTNIYPTNTVMRGVLVPPGVRAVRFEYRPFVRSTKATLLRLLGLILLTVGLGWFIYRSRREPVHA